MKVKDCKDCKRSWCDGDRRNRCHLFTDVRNVGKYRITYNLLCTQCRDDVNLCGPEGKHFEAIS